VGPADLLILAVIVVGVVSAFWLSRYAVAVHGLTRGIGDTVFYGADGQPWFRLDEQRHDVALDAYRATDLGRARSPRLCASPRLELGSGLQHGIHGRLGDQTLANRTANAGAQEHS